MSSDLRHQCDWLADAGYLALGPDLYSRGRKRACLRSTMSDLQAGRGRAFDDINAARNWLVNDERCNGQAGIIGYCMGGFSLLLAPSSNYSVSSVNYGMVPGDAEGVLAGACPIVASYGARDRRLKGAAARLGKALEADGVPCDVKEYPDAGRGFLNNFDGATGVLITVMGRLIGIGYHEPDEVPGAAALYVHRMAVRRSASGLGAVILGRAADVARQQGREALRLDCVASNGRRFRNRHAPRGVQGI